MFKVLAVSEPNLTSLAGFTEDRPDAEGRAFMMLASPLLSAIPGLRHAFFTREGGVSGGIYESLNGGLGSNDDPAQCRGKPPANGGADGRHAGAFSQPHGRSIRPMPWWRPAPWTTPRVRAPTPSSREHRRPRHRRHRRRLRPDPVRRSERARDRRGACRLERRADRHCWNPRSTRWKSSAPNEPASSPRSAR